MADEVRKLAEKTMEATREVGKVVSGIQNGTNDNLMAMQESTKRVNRSTELALSAGESLAAIVTIAEMTASQIHSIAAASEELSGQAQMLTQEELAARAGLSMGTVKNIENKGQSSIESVVRLGLALGLADHFQELFNLQVKSIAQMDQVERSKRIRAPRRVVK